MKIIIVDDDIVSLQTFLYEIIDVKDVEYRFFKDNKDEILNYVKDNNISKAFLDINMPFINGFDLAKQLIDINKDFKIVFVTGLSTTLDDVPLDIKNNTLGFIYKPYSINDLKHYLNIFTNTNTILEARMFNSFDCYIDNKLIQFPSKKSKELFALLLSYNGKSLEMYDAISQLWPDHDVEKAKKLYRDAVWKLRKVLDEYNINCIDFQRGVLLLDKSHIKCDYYDYLDNKNNLYNGSFCKSYDFSTEYIALLDNIALKRNSN